MVPIVKKKMSRSSMETSVLTTLIAHSGFDRKVLAVSF